MAFHIIRQDIAKIAADAVVISAGPVPGSIGGGEAAVYAAAGEEKLLKAREEIGILHTGDVKVTDAFALKAKYIFHVSAPVWQDGEHGEDESLRMCYRNALKKAEELKCESITFPLLASGTYRFPRGLALSVARDEIRSWLDSHDTDITLAVFDRESFVLSEKLEKDVRSYIDDRYEVLYMRYEEREESAPSSGISSRRKKAGNFRKPAHNSMPKPAAKMEDHFAQSLEDILRTKSETFTEMLLRMIDERGLKDAEVYKRANIDRKLFSKIRSSVSYHPKKKTVIALALALHLTCDETEDLLARSGYALSPASVSDLIIRYCLENRIYDPFEVDEILFRFDQPVLSE